MMIVNKNNVIIDHLTLNVLCIYRLLLPYHRFLLRIICLHLISVVLLPRNENFLRENVNCLHRRIPILYLRLTCLHLRRNCLTVHLAFLLIRFQ